MRVSGLILASLLSGVHREQADEKAGKCYITHTFECELTLNVGNGNQSFLNSLVKLR